VRDATTDTDGPEPRRHLLAAAIGVGVAAAWAVSLAATAEVVGSRRDRSGPVIAVFPRAMGPGEVLARVARADGTLVAETWLANAWHVRGEAPGFAGALRDAGATLVLPPLPYGLLGLPGCGGVTQGPR
jgi:hypothetical protein